MSPQIMNFVKYRSSAHFPLVYIVQNFHMYLLQLNKHC